MFAVGLSMSMSMISPIFAVALLLTHVSPALVPADLARAIREYDEAQVRGDRPALNRLLADDYLPINSRGQRIISWGRPDAIMDASTEVRRGQWHSAARAFALNPVGRRQTRKYRATVPVPECVAWWLDETSGPLVPDDLSKSTWKRMELVLGLPGDGQSGRRLTRRSIATLARKRMGEENWIQGRIMLGHVQPTTSDIYAVNDPAHLRRALAVTTELISEIEHLAPGAFTAILPRQ